MKKAVLNAAKKLSGVVVGCACHGIQLPPRHVLPEVRSKKRAPVDVESSSSDSTDDEAEAEEVTREEVEGNFTKRSASRLRKRWSLCLRSLGAL